MKDASTTATSSGNLLPWLMWLLGAAFYCYGFFQRVAPSVMVGELMRDFAVGATIAGVLSSLYFYTYAGLQIPIGLLLDRWGPRRMLTAAALLSALGSALFAVAPSLMPAYLGRALIGVGASVTWVGTLKLISVWFPPHRFAVLTGLTMAMGMAGAVGGQAPLAAAVTSFGWRGTLWGAAVVALIIGAATWIIVRDRKDAAEVKVDAPPGQGLMSGLKIALHNPQTYFAAAFGAMITAPMLSFAGLWGVPYMMQTHGLSRADAAIATSVILVGWGFGSPLVGWFTDYIGQRRLPMLITATGALLSLNAALYLPDLPIGALYVLFFLAGLFSGGIVLCFATGREHNPAWAGGAALGIVNMSVMSTGAIFQPLVGWLLDRNWDGVMVEGGRVYSAHAYDIALLTIPACHAAALIAALLVRETSCKHVE